MFARRESSPPPAPAPAPQPKDESETRDVEGIVIRQKLSLSDAYTYCHLAILLDGNEGLEPQVIRYFGSVGSSTNDAAICQQGDRIKFQICRSKAESPWSIRGGVSIIFDIEKERAKIAGDSKAS